MIDNRTIKALDNGYMVLDNETIYTCNNKESLKELISYSLASETSKGICSETYASKENAKKEFNNVSGRIIYIDSEIINILDLLEFEYTITNNILYFVFGNTEILVNIETNQMVSQNYTYKELIKELEEFYNE